jgi:excisionase family DNA binding protein
MLRRFSTSMVWLFGLLRRALGARRRTRRVGYVDIRRRPTNAGGTTVANQQSMHRNARRTGFVDARLPVLLTAEQVAELRHVPESWVYEAARERRIPHLRLGRYVRFERNEVDDWLATLRADAHAYIPRACCREEANEQRPPGYELCMSRVGTAKTQDLDHIGLPGIAHNHLRLVQSLGQLSRNQRRHDLSPAEPNLPLLPGR